MSERGPALWGDPVNDRAPREDVHRRAPFQRDPSQHLGPALTRLLSLPCVTPTQPLPLEGQPPGVPTVTVNISMSLNLCKTDNPRLG